MITNRLGLPQPFVDAATSHHEYRPNRYSVTELLGGTCEAILKRRHAGEQDEDVSDRVWAIFGTAVHKVLQEAEATDTQLQESWLSIPITIKVSGNCDESGKVVEPYENVGNYELAGIFDLYDDSSGTVTDYKTCATWKIIFGDFDDWRRQTLAYCWMLRCQGFDARRGEIVALMRDHNKRKARTEKGYPQHPVYRVGWTFTDADFEQMELDAIVWFSKVMHEETLPDGELEPCSPDQRWHKPDTWAVMEKGRKRALRVLESQEAATRWAVDKGIDPTDTHYYLEFRKGEDTKCEAYCSVSQFCPHMAGRD